MSAGAAEPPLSYIFSPADTSAWNSHLLQHGYCVLRSVLDPHLTLSATDLIWRDMARLFAVDRAVPSSWTNLPNGSAGILSKGLPQTEGPWLVRSHETVREVFKTIWDTDELLVSMDSLLCWLPWDLNPSWEPLSEGLHLDQNPFTKPDRVCVQGMIPLIDVSEAVGGLEVVPDSHTPEATARIMENNPHFNRGSRSSDWCPIRKADPQSPPPLLLMAKAGDLILWDSRTVHGGRVGHHGSNNAKMSESEVESSSAAHNLARLAVTVCMTPRSFATPSTLNARRTGFEKGYTFTHWPHEAIMTAMSPSGSYVPVKLSSRAQELI